jgi:phosphoribosylformylglycinamidine cyclo-ligase
MTARWPRAKLITNEKIEPGDVIVGLAGFGQANYETSYNSGLASNGLTSARHDVLSKKYGRQYPETFDGSLDDSVIYIGPYSLTELIDVDGKKIEVGKLLLAPTRTFAPVMKVLLEEYFESIHGLVHCSGGGQTKCLHYVPENVRIIKDNLFEPPIIFDLIQKASNSDDREMYQVFNMGTRMEIYTRDKDAPTLIEIAGQFGVAARVIGRVEPAAKKELVVKTGKAELVF